MAFIRRNGCGPRISLCMIVRNEEGNLPECLHSATDLVDELVIVDTGSTDGTKDIAQSFGARIIDFPWIDDFAAARNAGLDAAAGDWIFWVDADDRLSDKTRGRLRELFGHLPEAVVGYLMEYSCLLDASTNRKMTVDQIRLFPNHPSIRWEYRVHEQILPSIQKTGGRSILTDIVIDHLGYRDVHTRRIKDERNLRLLEMQRHTAPGDPFLQFYTGWTLVSLGRHSEAIPHLQSALTGNTSANVLSGRLPKTYTMLGRAQLAIGKALDALQTCVSGREAFPFDAELCFQHGLVQHSLGDYRGAAESFEQLTRMQPTASMAVGVDEGITTYVARHHLAIVYRDQGRYADAERQWHLALADCPDMRPALHGLAEVVLFGSNWPELESLCRRLDSVPMGQFDATILRARGHLARGELAQARQILEPTVAKYPAHVWPIEILSRVAIAEENWEAAAEMLRHILILDPSHKAAKYNLGKLESIQKDGAHKRMGTTDPTDRGALGGAS